MRETAGKYTYTEAMPLEEGGVTEGWLGDAGLSRTVGEVTGEEDSRRAAGVSEDETVAGRIVSKHIAGFWEERGR